MTTTTLNFKTFDNLDWQAYAGATAFADGTDPLIADLADGGEGQVIVDATGIGIYWGELSGDLQRGSLGSREADMAFASAVTELAGRVNQPRAVYMRHGFFEIN